jgi:ABC-type molybdate transport system substrate-binding protein
MGAEGVEFVGFLPDDMQLVTTYSAALGASPRSSAAAKDFLRFVTGPVGAERFRKSGWDVLNP